jgi:hypothetical protein
LLEAVGEAELRRPVVPCAGAGEKKPLGQRRPWKNVKGEGREERRAYASRFCSLSAMRASCTSSSSAAASMLFQLSFLEESRACLACPLASLGVGEKMHAAHGLPFQYSWSPFRTNTWCLAAPHKSIHATAAPHKSRLKQIHPHQGLLMSCRPIRKEKRKAKACVHLMRFAFVSRTWKKHVNKPTGKLWAVST